MIQATIDPLAEPGCYDGHLGDWIKPEAYHASDRLSRSKLVRILDSPSRFKDDNFNGSRATWRGDCAHSRVLEPERFWVEYAIPPESANRKTKDGKATWDAFVSACGWIDGKPTEYAKTIVGYDYAGGRFYRDDVRAVEGIAERIESLPKVQHMLQGPGITEGSYCWDDEGVRLRVRPDRRIKLSSGEWVLIDFKTTTDASQGEFARSMAKYSYHFQAAMYLEGVSRATGIEHKRFLFIAAETTAPFDLQLYELDQASIDRGRVLYRRAIDKYIECSSLDEWPDETGQLRPISLPSWALHD